MPLARVIRVGPRVTPAEVEQLAADSGYSRFPVTDGGVVLGYVHVKDALEIDDRDAPFLRDAIRPITKVAAQTRLDDVLTVMRQSGAHLAAVTDETGELSGLVVMADVLKELVGHRPKRV